jgi:hypothetical protein
MGVYKFSDASSLATDKISYKSMLAGNTTWIGWEPAGAFDALGSITVGSTSLASVVFTGIPTGYKHLQVRYIVKSSRSVSNPLDELNLRMNDDSGNNYAQHCFFGEGSGAGIANAVVISGNNIELGSGFIGDALSGSQFGVGILDILDYSSSSKTKTIKLLGGVDFNGAPVYGGRVGIGSGVWNSTSPITSLTLFADNGNIIQNSSFTLYGVK